MKVVIMAGGKGTRITSVAQDIPKPMIRIDDMPVLEREIICLKKQGFDDIIITVSHLGHIIMNYFGDGSQWNVHIEYFVETIPLGNAGALFKLKDKLTEDFLLLNGDVIFDIDFNRFVTFHKRKQGLATLFTHPNEHPYDSGLIVANENGCVEQWVTKEEVRPRYYKNRVNAGLHVISPYILEKSNVPEKVDLDRDILKPLAGCGTMYCYDSPEYVKDMGTPERYESVSEDVKNGIVFARNLSNRQKAVFLDRDGTINKYVGFLNDIDAFELLPGVVEAIQEIHKKGYLAIVVTNQPVIARGELSWDGLKLIHNKMETLLGNQGVYVDGIYVCPHHPDSGFKGEVPSLKIRCQCRKPEPGMLYKASADFNIELSESWMIGDSESDIKAGMGAGCKTALIGNGQFGQCISGNSLKGIVDALDL